MPMKIRSRAHRIAIAAMLVALMVLGTCASAKEVQLAGIRIDAPWVTVLDVYGCPASIVTYAPSGAAGGGAAGGMGGGMMPGGMGGPMMGGMPGMGGGMMGGMPGMGGEMMGTGMPGMAGMGGPMAGGMPGMGGGAAAGGGGGGFPMWALPVWVVLEEGEVEWFYQKGDVCLGFVFNRDGYVRVIAVAGEGCDYARTALWRPHRYVKLGDDFKRVLYRYGYPDEVEPFSADTAGGGGGGGAAAGAPGAGMPGAGMPGAGMPGGEAGAPPGMGGPMMGGPMMGGGMPGMGGPEAGAAPGAGGGGGAAAAGALGPISVTFSGDTNVLTRDAVLTYSDNNNIAFTLHNMKVTRIHIWK